MNTNSQKNRNFLALATALVLTVSTISAAFAENRGTAEQREACTPDVMRLCMSSVYSVDAIVSCMQKNKSQLSPQCRAVFSAIDRGPKMV